MLTQFKRKLRQMIGRRLHWNWRLSSGACPDLSILSDWHMFCDIFVDREYEPAFGPFFGDISTQSTAYILDLGANAGMFTLFLTHEHARRQCGGRLEIDCVEADPETVRRLTQNLARLDPNLATARIWSGLAGKRSGTATLQRHSSDHSSSVMTASGHRGGVRTGYLDLEKLVGARTRIDLLKVDIEGSEFDLVAAYPSLFARTRHLVIELHREFGDADHLRSQLAADFGSELLLKQTDQVLVVHFWRTGGP